MQAAATNYELRTTNYELRLAIAPTASCIVIHRLSPKRRTCKRQQQRLTEIMESAVSGEESTSSIQNQEAGRFKSQSLIHHLLFLF
ncbi:hypothetical protein DPMN_172912 [Dreissena polymorpha]|uniref:Uncharacterized protein n=1 Tax=Dreissena polymorpha TaxID=45954 RepID=A0A9D4E4H6_DREPO|nr:hypothetical protein DPMN_172912 [Dreissena polymorpha]